MRETLISIGIGMAIGSVTTLLLLAPGFYIPALDFIHCLTPRICIHEQGHRMDHKLGKPSETEAFHAEIQNLVISDPAWENWSKHNEAEEQYAQLWERANGDINNIPESLQKFFTEEAHE